MSSDSTICGLSIRLPDEDQNWEGAKKWSKIIGEPFDTKDDFYDIIQDEPSMKWIVGCDTKGTYGLVYYMTDIYKESEYDPYITFSIDQQTIYNIFEESPLSNYKELEFEMIRSFVVVYYNGNDCPFRF